MRSSKFNEGFSLIELLLVVAIVGVLSAIAIPNLLSSRRSANEASAISALRVISSGEATYQATAGGGRYGDLATLASLTLVDDAVGAATIAGPGRPRTGYLFSATTVAAGLPAFDAKAQPFLHTSADLLFATGSRSFTSTNRVSCTSTQPTPRPPAQLMRYVLWPVALFLTNRSAVLTG
jgi:prepilin-type N-terminal cleavage/methylation domain